MIVEAKVLKGIPKCPECKNYFSQHKDYGVWENGYWFIYRCEKCSTKRKKIDVRYFTDEDLKVIKKPKMKKGGRKK